MVKTVDCDSMIAGSIPVVRPDPNCGRLPTRFIALCFSSVLSVGYCFSSSCSSFLWNHITLLKVASSSFLSAKGIPHEFLHPRFYSFYFLLANCSVNNSKTSFKDLRISSELGLKEPVVARISLCRNTSCTLRAR